MLWNHSLWTTSSAALPPELVSVFDQIDTALHNREHMLFDGGTDADVVACACRAANARGWQVSTPRAAGRATGVDRNHIFLIRKPLQLEWVPRWLFKQRAYGYIGFAIHLTSQFPEALYRPRLELDGHRYRVISLPRTHSVSASISYAV